jgi:LCP family protein required for cell wall assembly
MSRKNIFLLLYSLGIAFVICLFLGVILLFDGRTMNDWGKRKPIPQSTQHARITEMPTQIPVTPTASVTATPTPLCGGPQKMILVLLGTDSRADSYYAGLADSIRLVRVDFMDPGLMVLPFQRDIYVEIPGIEEHGITHGKLNQAYTYGTPAFGYYDAPNQGLGLMELAMEHNFGVHVDDGVVINMQSFVRIIDTLGGIDVYLPYTIDGRVKGSSDPDLYFEAGYHHLNGYQAQVLARLRPNGDIERTNVQTIILQALVARLLSPAIVPELPELINNFQNSVYTDLDPVKIAQLTCLAAKLDPQKIGYYSFPEELFQGTRVQDPVLGNTFVWDVDFAVLRAFIASFADGTWNDPSLPTPVP